MISEAAYAAPLFLPFLKEIFEMSELCNNLDCFSVEIKGTSGICVTFVVYACGKSIFWGRGHMKKILLIDDSDIYIWYLQKYLQRRGYPVEMGSTLKEARTAIQEEMPLVICCDLDLSDGSGMDFFWKWDCLFRCYSE